MAMSATFTKAMVENNNVVLPLDEAKKLLIEKRESDHFVEEIFRGLYYKDEENRLIDVLRTNIAAIRDQYKKAIAMTALDVYKRQALWISGRSAVVPDCGENIAETS